MKKLLILIVLILAVGGIWYYNHRSPAAPEVKTETPAKTAKGHIDVSNATFLFDDGPVTLKNGAASTPIPDSSETQDTNLSDTVGYGDINNDGKEDAAAALIQSSGGSGVFIYVAGYISGPLGYKSTEAAFVGDRVMPKSISIKGSTITFTYLDRKPDEPLSAEPTVLTTKQYTYSSLDNSLTER